MVQPLWKTLWLLLRKLNTELLRDPAIPLAGMYLKELKEGTQTDSSVHSSIIYHSQKVETTQMSINR